jgi:hypothetical protein
MLINSNVLQDAAILVGSSLVAAAAAGFSLLKAYDEFRKGVEKKSRLRIWSALFIVSFLFILLTTIIVRF